MFFLDRHKTRFRKCLISRLMATHYIYRVLYDVMGFLTQGFKAHEFAPPTALIGERGGAASKMARRAVTSFSGSAKTHFSAVAGGIDVQIVCQKLQVCRVRSYTAISQCYHIAYLWLKHVC